MKKHTTAKMNRKALQATKDDHVFVGLDVHKRSIHAGIRINGTLAATFVIPPTVQAVTTLLEGMRDGIRRIVYEAGPSGFGLARGLLKQGFPVEVIAPGKTPQPANQENKSDRLDCQHLAEYAEKDMLRPIAIPTQQEESDRLICRVRDRLVKKQRRIKQQIKSLLLQFGIQEPAGLAHWSMAAVAELRTMELSWQVAFALNTLLNELDEVKGHITAVEKHFKKLAQTNRHKQGFGVLKTHPGVGHITAIKFITEIFRPDRFATANRVANYVGLAPRVRQSGIKRREGGVHKSGQCPLRALLIEASWRWRQQDERAAKLYDRLVHNTGSSQKAIVGVARHLALNLWHMLIRKQSYRELITIETAA